MTGALRKHSHYTYADYLKWPQRVRGEIIHGVFFDMAPAPSELHQKIVTELCRQVGNELQGKSCQVRVAPYDVRLPEKNEADEWVDTVVQPDLLVICDRRKIDERGCRGAPDWIVEVLSPATAQKDHAVKRALYEKHGVREFWLVHPTDRIVTTYTLSKRGRFSAATILPADGTLKVAALVGVKVDWRKVFAGTEL